MYEQMAANVLSNVAVRPPETGSEALPWPPAEEAKVASLADVYEAHFAYVYRCLRHLGVHEPQLDDATQDVFVVVHDKLHAFDGRSAITTWLYAIVIRVARRYRERQGKAKRFDTDEQLTSR